MVPAKSEFLPNSEEACQRTKSEESYFFRFIIQDTVELESSALRDARRSIKMSLRLESEGAVERQALHAHLADPARSVIRIEGMVCSPNLKLPAGLYRKHILLLVEPSLEV